MSAALAGLPPVTSTGSEPYKSISISAAEARKRARFEAGMFARQQVVDDSYAAQDIERFSTALWEYVGRLYTTRRKSPYKEAGQQFNSELASVVVAELLRKIPWLPCDNPLTPFDPSRSGKFTHFVNLISKSRHLSLVESHWKSKTAVDDRTDPMPEHDSGSLRITPAEAISDDEHDYIQAFAETLPESQRLLLEAAIANGGVETKDRYKLLRIQAKAKLWGVAQHAPASPRQACACHGCSKWLHTCSALMSMIDAHGVLLTTLAMIKGLPARRQRSDDWWSEHTREQCFADPNNSDGKSWTKPHSADRWEPIPAKLYAQLEAQ